MKQLPVRFESHQPERRRRGSTTLYGTCCTCCCCCLHSVGSLIGAAIAPSVGSGGRASLPYYEDKEPELAPTLPPATGVQTVESAIQSARTPGRTPIDEDEDRPSVMLPSGFGISAVSLFWLIFLSVSFISVPVGVLSGAGNVDNVLFQLVLALPAMQMVAVFIVLFILLCSSRIDRSYQLKQLGKITVGTLLGTFVGVILMVILARYT